MGRAKARPRTATQGSPSSTSSKGRFARKSAMGRRRLYAAGQMFLERPGELHAVSGNASATKPAKLLALLLAEKGRRLTTLA